MRIIARRTLAGLAIAGAVVGGVAVDTPLGHASEHATGRPAELTWRVCGAVSCTTLQVPLDHRRPAGRQITIGIARHEATEPANRIGTLFFATGVGGSPPDTLAARYPYFPADLRARFDFVAVGPRGYPHTTIAGTSTLDCGPNEPGFVSAFPTTNAGYRALVTSNQNRYEACRRNSGALIDHIGPDEQAADWDAVRAALGQRRITVLTFLHAGTVAQRYAALFPDRVRAMALDGPVNTATPFARAATVGAATAETSLRRFAAWCAANPPVPSPPDPDAAPASGCSLHGQDAVAAYRQLIIRAPVTAPGVDHPVATDEVAQLLSYFLYNGNYPGGGWVDLAATIYAAQHGNMRGLAVMYNASTAQPSAVYAHAATCMTQPAPPASYRALRAAVAVVRTIAPVTGGESGPWDHAARCAGWPTRPQPPGTAQEAPPVLIVPTRHDVYAPYELSGAVADQFASATVVTNDDDGHIAYLQSPCIQRVVNTYLITATAPPTGTACYPAPR